MLTAIQICCLTGCVGRTAFVPPLSSYELDPYNSIFLEPSILEVELSELTWAIPKSTSDWVVKRNALS